MEYISSDTNVWIDFMTIDRIFLPFRLPYIYLMNQDAIEEELLSPPDLKSKLLSAGLKATELSIEEFYLAESFGPRYLRLSVFDRIALAIAKNRSITLFTGDLALRKAAKAEGVHVIGTLGILDKLFQSNCIDEKEYLNCLMKLQLHNGKEVRLPSDELTKRIAHYTEIV